MAKVFLSYRRGDPLPNWHVKRIGKMCQECGFDEVFVDRDTGSIPPGSNYRHEIEKAIRACDVVLVLIGEKWQPFMEQKKNDPNDMIQIEIGLGLELGKTVVPILLGAPMPGVDDLPQPIRDFHYRNGQRFEPDTMDALMPNLLTQLSGKAKLGAQPPKSEGHPKVAQRSWVAPAASQHPVPAGMTFVWIPPGRFLMGSPQSEEGRSSNETQHEVTLTEGFEMAQTPVTQAQWKAIMGNNPSHFQDGFFSRLLGRGKDEEASGELPVEKVNWNDAKKFCEELSRRDAQFDYALPTEAEWEYACRAGTKGPYNVDGATLEDLGWFTDNSGSKTHPVKEKRPNAWNLHDMHGNVWEWCADYYRHDLGISAQTDPRGPETGGIRVIRGGSWFYTAQDYRSACRNWSIPGGRITDVGFRPVRKKKQS